MTLEYTLSFGGIPFLEDRGIVVRIDHEHSQLAPPDELLPPRKHQPETDLLDELDRVLPWQYLREYLPPTPTHRNQALLAAREQPGEPDPDNLRINDWYYPPTASRWSVFRGLMTSKMVKEVLDETGGSVRKTFVMKAAPTGPSNKANQPADFTLSTLMHLLPPRPLAELGGQFDGLFLVTLVDERYYHRGTPIHFRLGQNTTWSSLIDQLATALGITINAGTFEAVYGQPEPDSQFWSSMEDAAVLLDAVAYNLGRVVVRNLNGTYDLLTATQSIARISTNRGNVQKVVRAAGGDLFYSGTLLPAGSLTKAKDTVVPATVAVTFPKYIQGDDPVPHFVNPRYQNQRPSAWHEDGYGDVHTVSIGIRSGGNNVTSLSGVGTQYLHDTAKALYSGEVQAVSGTAPVNASGLTALALQLAKDHYDWQAGAALDEVYPGTPKWSPEGFHDLIWTYSPHIRKAQLRVMKAEWNNPVTEFQHAAVALSGQTNTPKGVGGKSVAQTWRDSYSGAAITTTLNQSGIASGDASFTFLGIGNFPTQNRWRGRIDQEDILFEGTSGGFAVNAAQRGIDGTLLATHLSGATITYLRPDAAYGVNLITAEKMQFVFPAEITSGGIQGVNFVPQVQTVEVLGGTPTTIRSLRHYSGRVLAYDTTQASGGEFLSRELCWVIERNNVTLMQGRRLDGQFAGFSASGPVAPVYLASESMSGGGSSMAGSGILNVREATDNDPIVSGVLILEFLDRLSATSGIGFVVTSGPDNFAARVGGLILSGGVTSGLIGNAAVVSGSLASGIVSRFALASGAVNSGHIAAAAVVSGSLASGATGNNLLDGFFHFDTVAGSPAIGSLPVGNSGNLWERFPVGVSGQVLSVSPTSGQGVAWRGIASGLLQSGTTGNNLLDGFYHFDTLAGSVLRGDLITGQGATPRWATLTKGISGQVLTMTNADDPDWVSPFSGDTPVVLQTHPFLVPPSSGLHTDVVSGAASIGVLVVGNSGNLWERFATGNSGQVLTIAPTSGQGVIWKDPATAASMVINHWLLVPPTGGGSGQHTDVVSGAPLVGSLIGGSGTSWVRISGSIKSGRMYLSEKGDATNSELANWHQIRAVDLRFLGVNVNAPNFSGGLDGIASGQTKVVQWFTEAYDIDNWHTSGGERLTCTEPGYYRVWANWGPTFFFISGDAPLSGFFQVSITKNSVTAIAVQNCRPGFVGPAGNETDYNTNIANPYTSLELAANDYLEVFVTNFMNSTTQANGIGGFGVELMGVKSG